MDITFISGERSIKNKHFLYIENPHTKLSIHLPRCEGGSSGCQAVVVCAGTVYRFFVASFLIISVSAAPVASFSSSSFCRFSSPQGNPRCKS